MIELFAEMQDIKFERVTNTREWLEDYSAKWLEKNKPSELCKIQEMFIYCEDNY